MSKVVIVVATLITLGSASAAAENSVNSRAIAAHNQYRAMHGASKLVYDQSLASSAQKYAEELAKTGVLKHASDRNGAGENLAMQGVSMSSGAPKVDIAEYAGRSVSRWYQEKAMYDYSKPGFSMSTGHFTQVVWKGTRKIGCGAATRNKDTRTVQVFVACRYFPPGNYARKFPENVSPR